VQPGRSERLGLGQKAFRTSASGMGAFWSEWGGVFGVLVWRYSMWDRWRGAASCGSSGKRTQTFALLLGSGGAFGRESWGIASTACGAQGNRRVYRGRGCGDGAQTLLNLRIGTTWA
jgi:hypothetical protein